MKHFFPNGSSNEGTTPSDPDTCPVCHKSGEMIKLTDGYVRGPNMIDLQVVYRCPRHKCGSIFIQEFHKISEGKVYYYPTLTFPNFPEEVDIPEEIKSVSENFSALFNQALHAKQSGFKDIYGMGLRKSLEFLLKDYCISKNPDDELDIKNEFLGSLIKNRIADPNIKACAERATWLGNDESHYEKRWNSHDAEDLKRLIQLTMNWIQSEILTQKYLEEMNN